MGRISIAQLPTTGSYSILHDEHAGRVVVCFGHRHVIVIMWRRVRTTHRNLDLKASQVVRTLPAYLSFYYAGSPALIEDKAKCASNDCLYPSISERYFDAEQDTTLDLETNSPTIQQEQCQAAGGSWHVTTHHQTPARIFKNVCDKFDD